MNLGLFNQKFKYINISIRVRCEEAITRARIVGHNTTGRQVCDTCGNESSLEYEMTREVTRLHVSNKPWIIYVKNLRKRTSIKNAAAASQWPGSESRRIYRKVACSLATPTLRRSLVPGDFSGVGPLRKRGVCSYPAIGYRGARLQVAAPPRTSLPYRLSRISFSQLHSSSTCI
uniref:Uncharacterized protein n=1 Tax=Trichogramma kaykai TaxID=54128 RepID=A0ABD2XPI9_9HYME